MNRFAAFKSVLRKVFARGLDGKTGKASR
jgi:hypothetical protein